MRELPRKLSREELTALFEGDTVLVQRLAGRENPLGAARQVVRELSEEEKLEVLNVHPAIGATGLSATSSREQGSGDDPELLAQLAKLNRVYEDRFGFRFVVFVNRRARSAIVPVLEERLGRPREEELETALDELVAIACDRWQCG